MSDFGMMPSWWVGGNPNAMFQNNLAQNQAAMAGNANFFSGLQNIGKLNQASLSNAYGPGGFGGDTAKYAALAAAYGRATGGFGKMPGGGPAPAGRVGTIAPTPPTGASEAPPARVDVAPSAFDTANAGPVPYLSDGGMPFGGGGFSPGPSSGPVASGPMPFGDLWRGRVTPPLPSIDPSISDAAPPPPPIGGPGPGPGFPWGGTGGRTGMPSSQALLGYDPEQSAKFAPGGGEGFQGRFGMGLRGAGMPSQYTTDPYRDVEGITYPPNIPPGFQTPFSVDNPGGALSAGGLRGMSPPIMNAGDEPSDTLTAGDRAISNPFEAGAPHIGPTMGPFMSAGSGAGWGRRMAPPDYAPSSPFGSSGASPVPYPYAGGQAFPTPGIGGYRGDMRDRIAAVMSGSEGMKEPPSAGGPIPLPQSRPQGAPLPIPTPTQPQMSDAWRRIGAGPGSPGVSSVAQQVPPPPAPYAKINQAIFDIGNASRPGMFDNPVRPLGEMFMPGRYRGLGR